MLKEFLTRLHFLFSGKTHHDVDEELQFHLEQQVQANVSAGMQMNEARRQAGIAFGGIEHAREACRRQRPGYRLELLLADMRYALRGFKRAPVFTLTVVATLMLGIGVTTAVFSVVDRILFRSLPYADADRLVSLGLVQSLETQEFMTGGFYFDWRERQHPFIKMSAEGAAPNECDLTEHNPAQLSCARIESGLLPLLGVVPILGRNFLSEEDQPHGPNVALISYNLWQSHYNSDASVLKSSIQIDGNPVTIVGVLPPGFELPSLHPFDVIFPLALDEAAQRKLSPGRPMRAIARLKPGISINQARTEMGPLFQSAAQIIPSEIRKDFHLKVQSLNDRQMQRVRPVAWVLLATAFAVLLIACANVASLLLSRGAVRARELAVRSALGASRGRLASQAIAESILLSAAGALAGIALAGMLLHIVLAIAPPSIPYLSHIHLDLRIFCFTIGFALLAGLTFGLAPALQRSDGMMLSARVLLPTSHARLRQLLVVGQIAVSLVILTGAMLLLRSFWNLQQQQLGMNTQNTLTVGITLGPQKYGSNEQELAFFQQLQTRLHYGPGVTLVASSDSLPPATNHNQMRFSSIGVDGQSPSANENGGLVTYRWVSPEYFRIFDIPILRGRGFSEEEDSTSEHLVVLSKTLATRLFPNRNPIGQQLQLDRAAPGGVGGVVSKASQGISPYTVVGVAADVKNGGIAGEDLPEYYRLRRNRPEDWQRSGAWGASANLILRTSIPPEAIAPWIRAQVGALDPTLPVDIETMQQRVSKLADQPRFQATLVSFFAATGLVLAVIGLYGVISFLVVQRRQEIGVRMALGASRGAIVRLIVGRSLRLVVWGISLGLISALGTSRVLSSLLFSIGPHDPATFAFVTLLLVFVALVATLIPANSAAKVNPIIALRCD